MPKLPCECRRNCRDTKFNLKRLVSFVATPPLARPLAACNKVRAWQRFCLSHQRPAASPQNSGDMMVQRVRCHSRCGVYTESRNCGHLRRLTALQDTSLAAVHISIGWVGFVSCQAPSRSCVAAGKGDITNFASVSMCRPLSLSGVELTLCRREGTPPGASHHADLQVRPQEGLQVPVRG